jgi:hypothetical protein
MNDFEVVERGTSREIRLSRELANEIDKQLVKNPDSVPLEIVQAYKRLYGEYIRQQQLEV